MKGIYTIERIEKERNISRQSAINLISRLKKKGLVKTNGGGKQIRFYKISEKPLEKENGMYEIINKYTPIKLYPTIKHIVYGRRCNVEQTIIDCLKMKDSRHSLAAAFLMNHIKNWGKMKELVILNNVGKEFGRLYDLAKEHIKIRKINLNFEMYLRKMKKLHKTDGRIYINANDIESVKNDKT